ncbi:hypothetical protein KVG96_08885 [Pseudomonas sp. COR58]|uniref:Uncharacterized protein n=1 Tax=Pseudomonas ekonensis TaxID=2842353 RepID=A0ABS6PC59_9PSED|nr:hypothetical protein [Pseudomonas ekonensis]MBV4458060.1 hypothetical protein [Pseudomonas ekonensis]
MFFGNGRKPLLDFLRNMTPQILFLAIALVAGSKLNLDKFDLSFDGVRRTLPFAMCLFVFFASTLANLTTFLEESLVAVQKNGSVRSLELDGVQGVRRIWLLLVDAWSRHKLSVFRMVLVMVVAETAMVAVFLMGIQSAAVSPFLSK